MSDNNYVLVVNMTNFFNRELFMYSLGDIKFKKPVALKKVAYTTFFIIVWAIPMLLTFGLILSPVFLAFMLVPPIVLGHFAAKPVWGGRGLLDFVKTLFGYIGEPKGWTDLNATNVLDKETLFVAEEIWVSRRRELQYLADIKEERENKLSNNSPAPIENVPKKDRVKAAA